MTYTVIIQCLKIVQGNSFCQDFIQFSIMSYPSKPLYFSSTSSSFLLPFIIYWKTFNLLLYLLFFSSCYMSCQRACFYPSGVIPEIHKYSFCSVEAICEKVGCGQTRDRMVVLENCCLLNVTLCGVSMLITVIKSIFLHSKFGIGRAI